MATAWKSTCWMVPYTGSRCSSLMRTWWRAGPLPLSSCNSMSPWAPAPWTSRSSCRASTATGVGPWPPPYSTPGTRPARRRLLALCFPVSDRRWAASTASLIATPPRCTWAKSFPAGGRPTRQGRRAQPRRLHLQELADGDLLEDAPDGLGEQGGDGQHPDLGHPLVHRQGDGVGHHQFLDGRRLHPLGARVRQDRVSGGGVHLLGPFGQWRPR